MLNSLFIFNILNHHYGIIDIGHEIVLIYIKERAIQWVVLSMIQLPSGDSLFGNPVCKGVRDGLINFLYMLYSHSTLDFLVQSQGGGRVIQ
ncbi:hypothetical protein SAMN06265218_102348 [Fodinibius sediminis]|uniref:Uncharacterized protein n=1 Tax=Fodinibius sediminis TaxID=1214077 RepID=A0A521BB75_9BACT|nr:hypothetical protein SAMN06265218_102348 [Fodinibius sediminis]